MKRYYCAVLCIVMLACWAPAARPQAYNAGLQGKITKGGEPVPNLQILANNSANGRQYKTKTNKKGEYSIVGMSIDSYVLKVVNESGEVVYVNQNVSFEGNEIRPMDIDLSDPAKSGGRKGMPADAMKSPGDNKKSKEDQKAEEAKIKDQNAKIAVLNGYITQYQTAKDAQNYVDAEKALKHVFETVPDTTRWEFYRALGDVQSENNELNEAIQTYEKGIQKAQLVASGNAPKDPFNPNADPAKAKAGIGPMLVAEGNAYVKLGKPELATPLFQQAGQDNPNPATQK